ncbi:hypothetical protein KFL_001990010 [Klebsormidium nitens]|uniref:Uncharacterized protein n=1 Tax=Klebsormidium nitens TaxID=105231 RepID=A0A1Y1I7F1_KLENI|nr:hypothetical protein KFL_001990010 [Klebsormidium nitens]|eukprot:GAQ84646.1 hypothetical protein KFL_001990010 [Klebsormidium nitens]
MEHSYWPAMGTYKGGTNLTVLLESTLTGQTSAWLYCRFDSIIVFNVDYNARAPEGPTVTFVVPPFVEGKKEVGLAFSVDGLHYEPFGKFVYHEPLMIFLVEPPAGPPEGGHKVSVRLLNPNPFLERVTAADVRLLAEPKCLFQDATVPGTYEPASDGYPWLSVSCSAPPGGLGTVDLSVSLNGQEYTSLPGTYAYTADTMQTQEQEADVEPGYITTETTEAASSFYYYTEKKTAQDPVLLSACMMSIYPRIGPGATSSAVSVSLGVTLPVTGAKRPLCRFGTNVTTGYYNVGTKIGLGNGTFVYCPAPTMPLGGTVPLSISMDGTTFTGAASFTYYTPLTGFNVSNLPPVMNQLGPFEAVIQLSASPFPAAFTSFDQVAFTAWCCLDGSYSFRVPAPLSFVKPTDNTSAPVPVPSPDVGVPLFGLGNVLSLGPPLKRPTPVPADTLCLKYNADPSATNANLTSVGIDQGVSLSPAFSASTTIYNVIGNDPKAVTFAFSLTPAGPGANVSVDLLSPVSVSGSPIVTGLFRGPLVPGTNIFTVRVTGPNGFTQMTYYIYVTCQATALVTSLTADAAALAPAFAEGVYSYALSVNSSVQQIVLTAASNGTRYTLVYNAAVYDPAQPLVVYPSNTALTVGVTAVLGVPSNLLCRNYTTAANTSKPLFPGGGMNISMAKLPGGYGFLTSPSGALTATLALDCFGTKVFYVWVTQTDKTAVVYTLTVKRAMPADLTPALSILDVISGGTDPTPPYNISNPADTVYSITATSIYQQLMLGAQPAAPVAAVRTVPDQVKLDYGHNTFSLALTGLDYVSKASYSVDAFVPSGVLAQMFVQYLIFSVFMGPILPGQTAPSSNFFVVNTGMSPQFQSTGPFNYSVGDGQIDSSQIYVLLTTWEWDATATTTVSCWSGCSGPLYVTDQTWLTRVSSSISIPATSTLNSTQWAQRMSVWVLGLAYGVNQVQVNVTGSLGDSSTYYVSINRDSLVADDATLTLVNVSAPNGTQAFGGAQFSPLTQAYNVSLPKPVPSLLFSVLTKNPAATVSMTVDSIPVAPSQISASYSPPAPTTQTLTNNLQPLPSQTVPPATYWQWGIPFGNVTAGVVRRVDFTVTCGSAQAVYSYWLSVAIAHDASLSSVGIYYVEGTQVPIPLSSFQLNGNQQMYTASVPKAVQALGLYAIPTNPASSISLNTSAPSATVIQRPVLNAPGSWVSPTGFSLGPVKTDSLFSLGVTAPDGVSKQVYLLDVVRLAGTDATLRSLNATVNGTVIQLDLRADPVQVPGLTAGTSSARFAWAATDSAAASAYSLDGTTVLSGTSVTLSLSPGTNSFKVRVVSEDGAATGWYSVNAMVPITAGATLATMAANPGVLVPNFSPSVAQYSLRLPSNVAIFVLNASAADRAVQISSTGTNPPGQSSLNFPGEMRYKADVGGVILGVNPSMSGPARKYTVTVTALKDYEMLTYLDFMGSQMGIKYQAPPSNPSFPNPGGLAATAGQQVQFQVAANCSRYQRNFGGDSALCEGMGTLVVQLILGPAFGVFASIVTNATCTVAKGTLSYTPVAAGLYVVQAALATCQQLAGYCDSKTYKLLYLPQTLMVLPASDISPQNSALTLPDAVIDDSGSVHATFTPRDTYGNMQTSTPIRCIVCPPTADAAPQNASFCPAVNLTATTQLYATGAYDLAYVTSLAGMYQVVVYDNQGNRILDGLQRVALPRSAPIDGGQSSLLVPPGGLSVGQPDDVISVTLVPRDKAGNLIQFMDDSASISGTLTPVNGTGTGGQSAFRVTSGNSTAAANFTMYVSVSGLRPGGTYQLRIYARDVQIQPTVSVTLPPAISDRSVTSSGPPQSVQANAVISYHLLPLSASSQKIGFGGEASFIQVGICAAGAESAASASSAGAGSGAVESAAAAAPACPTLAIVSAQVKDSLFGDYTIALTAPPQAGTYQITTIVSGNPLKEGPKMITVVPAGGNSGGSPSPAPAPASVPVPAPAPDASGNVPLIVPGLKSIQLLTQEQTPNGASLSFRVRD